MEVSLTTLHYEKSNTERPIIKKRLPDCSEIPKPLITKQVLRHRLVDWITQIECLKQLTYHIVRMKVAGLNATKEISMGKALAGELGFEVANGCLQMFGGTGYINESLITRYFRDTRLTSIGGGATEIMKEVIARLEGF